MSALQTLAVLNYRSLRDFVIPLGSINVITGPNGSGKSNVYRALRLLAETAQGGVIASLAREGGLSSTLWAGPETLPRSMRSGNVVVQGGKRKNPVSLGLGFAGEQFSYAIDLGLPSQAGQSMFTRDPVIKGEYVWSGPLPRPGAMLAERKNALIRIRSEDGAWESMPGGIGTFDSMLSYLSDPRRTPELLSLREQVRSWRFYDHFRTDGAAPARMPQVGTHTPVLGNDGADLAAALQTIMEIGDDEALDEVVADAFPGSVVGVAVHDGRFETTMTQQGLLRPLKAAELSDGTLRYLLWIAALLSPRPPQLLVLNEPETSLHPDLLPALGRLIGRAAQRSQVIVVSHARRLIAALEEEGCRAIILEKSMGETTVSEFGSLDAPVWNWVTR